jgi:hypothetical protein
MSVAKEKRNFLLERHVFLLRESLSGGAKCNRKEYLLCPFFSKGKSPTSKSFMLSA